MKKTLLLLLCLFGFLAFAPHLLGEDGNKTDKPVASDQPAVENEDQVGPESTREMLASLLELRKNLKEQINLSQKKFKASSSDAEKSSLEAEIAELDKQLSENSNDFERIATGIEPALFAEKKPETFSWKDEMASLVEPAIKELKRFTIRARQKTELKDRIAELKKLSAAASEGVINLEKVLGESESKEVVKEVKALQPEWQNIEQRLDNKLELAKRELAQLEAQDVSLVETSSISIGNFFRDRGMYLIVAILSFFAILLGCRLLYRLLVQITVKIAGKEAARSFRIRLLYVISQVLSIVLAITGLFFVLYLAEDWFLLSMAIVFFLGMGWTVRQGLPRLWQEGRLMLNVGSVRENERIIFHGVPWKVASINVFSKLVNPTLETELRVPIEQLIGLTSRPYSSHEPWFPCRRGDWVVIGDNSRARVISQTHEQVELVERGGRRVYYPTEAFLQASPANLSRDFRLRVPFGVSYSLQEKVTDQIPATLKQHISNRLEEDGYATSCNNLNVEFMLANSSSLDILILADFDGGVADISKRIERAIQKYCVECCTANDWEIPFPQLTVHRPLEP